MWFSDLSTTQLHDGLQFMYNKHTIKTEPYEKLSLTLFRIIIRNISLQFKIVFYNLLHIQ